MTEIEILILFIATILGAITTSGLGWLDSGTHFNARKFIPGLIRGIIAAILVFIAQYTGFIGDVTLFTYLGAYLAGGGFDVLGNRLAGIAKAANTSTPPTT